MSEKELLSFHNDPLIKEKYLLIFQNYYQADEIIKGTYWENGKGCAIGCTLDSGQHVNYKTESGIPEILLNLEYGIFKSLPNKMAKEFPLQFLSAINVGANLSDVWKLFAIWLLTDAKYGVLQYSKDDKPVQDVVDAYIEDITTPVPAERWEELRKASYATAAAAVAAFSAVGAVFNASAAYAYSSKKKDWYVAASKKLIELLKEAK